MRRKIAWECNRSRRVKIVRRYAPGGPQALLDEQVEYCYDSLPVQFQNGTGFALPSGVPFTVGNGLGRLVMTRTGASRILELYSYSDGGQVRRKRVEAAGQKLEVGYDFDAGGRVMLMTGVTGPEVQVHIRHFGTALATHGDTVGRRVSRLRDGDGGL
jgi:hypothetical protein